MRKELTTVMGEAANRLARARGHASPEEFASQMSYTGYQQACTDISGLAAKFKAEHGLPKDVADAMAIGAVLNAPDAHVELGQ